MTATAQSCFHELDPDVRLSRRAAAEGLGTMCLVFAVSAVGLATARLLPSQPAAAIFVIAVAVSGALVSLIIAFGKLSGGHFNPLITGLQMMAGERSIVCAAAYVACQIVGGLAGGALAAGIWHEGPQFSGGLGWQGIASEFVASAGLMLVVLGAARSGRPETGPFAVGAWLMTAVIATPTGSYANPAVVLGSLVSAGPIALGAGSAVPYMGAEVAGALLALAIISLLFPSKLIGA